MRRLLIGIAVGALVLAACGKSRTTARSSGKTATSASPGQPTVATATAGSLGTILVDSRGRTLYHLTTETNGKIACTGGCSTTWPPLKVPAEAMEPVAGPGVTGSLGSVPRPDGGAQVTYNGMPLYTYSGDSKAGDTKGQGVGGVWYVVKPSSAGSAGTTPTTAAGGGYTY